jgi:hypothetical protein
MFRKIATAAVLAATVTGAAAAPAQAQRYYRDGFGYQQGYGDGYGYRRGYGYRPTDYARHHGWARNDYGYRCHDQGNGGLAIGAIAGGLLGHEIAGRGDRTLGTVLGAAGGGLLGRSIDRHDGRC